MRMKQPKKQRSRPRDQLFQKMSEVISLREKVAQAELVARVLKPTSRRAPENGRAAAKGDAAISKSAAERPPGGGHRRMTNSCRGLGTRPRGLQLVDRL